MAARARTGLLLLVWLLCGLALLGLHFVIVLGSLVAALIWPGARHARLEDRAA